MATMSIAEALRTAIAEEMRRDERVFCIGVDIDIEGGFGWACPRSLATTASSIPPSPRL